MTDLLFPPTNDVCTRVKQLKTMLQECGEFHNRMIRRKDLVDRFDSRFLEEIIKESNRIIGSVSSIPKVKDGHKKFIDESSKVLVNGIGFLKEWDT